MKLERSHLVLFVPVIDFGIIQETVSDMKLVVIIFLSDIPNLFITQFTPPGKLIFAIIIKHYPFFLYIGIEIPP